MVAGEVSRDGLPPVVWRVGTEKVHGHQITEDVPGREGEGEREERGGGREGGERGREEGGGRREGGRREGREVIDGGK